MRQRIVDWAKGFGLIRLAVLILLGSLTAYAVYYLVDSVFNAPARGKKAEATAIVAKEQGQAEEVITTETLETMQESESFKVETREKVSRGQGKVNVQARRPKSDPSRDAAIHDAGIDELCQLHDSFCGDAGPEAVREVH
jgi:autonomous glycyl radical cofactor GrcA